MPLVPPAPGRAEPQHRVIARAIETRILAGEIVPGDPLPSEMGLAEQWGVGRSTIREAIRLLEQNGLVKREEGRKKLTVTVPRSSDVSKRVTQAMVMQQVTFDELWEAMYALEPAAAHAAARRADADDIAALEANLAATRRALEDKESLTALDIEFHDLVARASKNRALQIAREPLTSLFYPPFYIVMNRLNAAQRLLVAHENVLEAIRGHDARKAREWMEKHVADFKRGHELADIDMSQPVERIAIG